MNNSLKRRVEGSLYAVQLLSLIASKDLEDADYMDGLVERMIRDGSHTAIEEEIAEKPEPIARLGQQKCRSVRTLARRSTKRRSNISIGCAGRRKVFTRA